MSAVAASLSTEPTTQGWHARLKLGFKKQPNKTVLSERKRHGPLAVQRAFYPEKDVCHIYLLHPPGGVVGGDRLDIELDLAKGSHALLTTPGATKFYRSAGEAAIQQQLFNVEENATLEWLPQENIFFPGAIVKSALQLNLAANAKAAVWEIQCFGRPVINEAFDAGALDSHWKIYRDNKPLLIERLRVDPQRLQQLSQLQGQAVSATFAVTNVTKAQLEALREHSYTQADEQLGMTLIDDLLIVRYLGMSTENVRGYFSNIWSQLRETSLACKPMVPRIWNT